MKRILSAMAVVIALCGVVYAYPNFQPSNGDPIQDNVTGTYTGTVDIDTRVPALVWIDVPGDHGGKLVFPMSMVDELTEKVLIAMLKRTVTVTITTTNGTTTVTADTRSH